MQISQLSTYKDGYVKYGQRADNKKSNQYSYSFASIFTGGVKEFLNETDLFDNSAVWHVNKWAPVGFVC